MFESMTFILMIFMALAMCFFVMMPITSSSVDGGSRYGWPILGSITERLSERLDVSALDGADVVDDDGFLIPGTVLRIDAKRLLPISGGGQTARGITFEAIKVAESNSSAHLAAADDLDVVICVAATIDRAIAEYNLDRAYTANELTAFDANDRLTLTDPET